MKFFPCICTPQSFLDRTVYFVFHLFGSMQLFRFNGLFAFGIGERILVLKHFCHFLVALEIVAVGNHLPVEVHPVEDDVAVRVVRPVMPHHDELRVPYPHQLQVFLRQPCHERVGQPRCVLRLEAERNVPHRFRHVRIQQALPPETACRLLHRSQQHAFRGDDFCVVLLRHVAYAAAERAAFPDLPYHEAILLSACNHP